MKSIYIYCGPGASPTSAAYLQRGLTEALQEHGFRVKFIDDTTLNNCGSHWRKDASLIVFGGGAFTQVKEALSPYGLKAVRDYVRQGGKYLGVCKGGYAGAEHIDFIGADGPKRNTGLGFFNGIARGALPITPAPFSGLSDSAAIALFKHESTGMMFPALYWGGPSFKQQAENGNTADLVTLISPEGERVVTGLEARVGKNGGRAVLTGFHPEAASPDMIMDWTGAFPASEGDIERLQTEIESFPTWHYLVGLACVLDDLKLVRGHSFLNQILQPGRNYAAPTTAPVLAI